MRSLKRKQNNKTRECFKLCSGANEPWTGRVKTSKTLTLLDSVSSRAAGVCQSISTETANQNYKGVTEIMHKDSIKITLDALWVEAIA